VAQNHEGKLDNFAGGILNTGDVVSPITEIPPVKNPENRSELRHWRYWRYWRYFLY
jgi:hypothetical protein